MSDTAVNRFLRICAPGALILLLLGPVPAACASEIWLLVNTEALTLEVHDGDRTLETFSGVSIGRGGATRDKRHGDDKTPLGMYKVAWFNPASRFHLFIGIDYPRWRQVERAYGAGDIDAAQRRRLLDALYHGRLPPQNTPLGGNLGIHGLGRGDRRLHEMANWTEGCVALTNEQIDRLRRWVKIGTPVFIR